MFLARYSHSLAPNQVYQVMIAISISIIGMGVECLAREWHRIYMHLIYLPRMKKMDYLVRAYCQYASI